MKEKEAERECLHDPRAEPKPGVWFPKRRPSRRTAESAHAHLFNVDVQFASTEMLTVDSARNGVSTRNR